MAPQAKAEHIIEEVAGCGIFQVIFFVSIILFIKSVTAYGIMFMAFGNYHPGWRCLDNVTDSILSNQTGLVNATQNVSRISEEYVTGSCDAYNECDNIEFNPESSTIVTEWQLTCDRSWIVSLIISMQMLGMLVGSYFTGQVADLIGRKKMLCINLIACSISHLASRFSVSWAMLVVFKLMLGTFASGNIVIMFLYMSEYMTQKWRAVTMIIPVWYIGSSILAFAAWMVKDWRQVEFIGFVLNIACLIPLIAFAPESLRWLEVKKKGDAFMTVSKKILKLNRKEVPSFEGWDFEGNKTGEKEEKSRYTIFDLFRKNFWLTTICIMFLHFSFSMLYYALSFGAKSLYGDFYFNLFVSSVIPIPFGVISMLVMRVLSRRGHTIVFLIFTVICSIASIAILLFGDQAAKDFGSTVLISVAKSTLDAAWTGVYARNAEMYPTVVRGIAVGVGSMSARIGGILAPFVIPDDESVLYIFMIAMAVLTVICCLVSIKLPETKGKSLKETFDDKPPVTTVTTIRL